MKTQTIDLFSFIKGQWRPFEYTVNVQCEPEDIHVFACRTMAELLVTACWPGSALKATWDEGDGDVTLLHTDPILDEYVIEERENQRQRAEEARYQFRSAS